MIRRIKQAYSNLNPKRSNQWTDIRLADECRARFVHLRTASYIELKREKDENGESADFWLSFHPFLFHEWAPYHDRWHKPIAVFEQECFRLRKPHALASLILTEHGQFLDSRLRFIDTTGALPIYQI